MKNLLKFSFISLILALGMILSAALLSKLFINIKHEKNITTKGYAERNVTSDIGKFYCSYSIRKPSLEEAYEALQKNKKSVLAFLKSRGFAENEIVVHNISTSKIYKKDAEGNRTNEIEYYQVSQGITIMSKNVNLIDSNSKKITELIKEGIDIYAQNPMYYISNLNDIKLELISDATKDGYRRAQTMAKNSGGRVGTLCSARQGVFQITQPYSTQTSGYGIYDTATILKTVKSVVTLEYTIVK